MLLEAWFAETQLLRVFGSIFWFEIAILVSILCNFAVIHYVSVVSLIMCGMGGWLWNRMGFSVPD